MGIDGLIGDTLQYDISDTWHEGHRLKLVAGMHETDHKLTKLIEEILKKEFGLKGVEIRKNYTKEPIEYKHLPPKNKPHIVGTHPNTEARQDIGKNKVNLLERDMVVYIAHPYNTSQKPKTTTVTFEHKGEEITKEIKFNKALVEFEHEGVKYTQEVDVKDYDTTDVATTIMNIRGFGDIIKQAKINTDLLTLVTPVGPYDLGHSVLRKKREGKYEANFLAMYLKDMKEAGFDQIIAIHSHSPTTEAEAKRIDIDYIDIDPFRTEAECGETLLGPYLYEPDAERPRKIKHREDYDERIKQLTPFMTHIKEQYQDKNEVYFIATDDGIWPTIEKICYQYRNDKQQLIGILKERIGAGDIKIKGIRTGSTATLDEIAGKTVVLCDDRRLSGGTLNDIAKVLKEVFDVKAVDAYITHDMSVKPNFGSQKYIDKLTLLETNPNSFLNYENDPRVQRFPMEDTARLMAAEIYKSYCSLRENGKPKVR